MIDLLTQKSGQTSGCYVKVITYVEGQIYDSREISARAPARADILPERSVFDPRPE